MRGILLCICTLILPIIVLSQTITYSGTLSICSGETKTLTVTGAPGGATFKWMRDNVEIPGQVAINYHATLPGSYVAEVNGTPTPAVVLTVFSNPTAAFTVSSQNDCANVTTAFTNTSSGSGLSYLWNFDDPNSGTANTSTDKDPSRVFVGLPGNDNQTFAVSLKVTDANNCSNTTTSNVVKKKMPGTKLDGTGIKIYDEQTYYAICGSTAGSFTFTNVSETKSTNTNYLIVWGNGSPNLNEGPSFTTSTQNYTTGVHNLTFTVTGGNGCIATSEKKVFVGSNPSIGIANPGSTSVCTGATLSFPITNAINNTPGTTYTVNFNDGTAPSVFTHPAPASVSHVFPINSCGQSNLGYNNSFYVSILASNACESSSSFAVPIFVSNAPQANFTAPTNPVCVNTTVNLSGNATSIQVATGNGCANSQSIWSITPSTGFVLQSGTDLGDDNGSNNPLSWTRPGTNNLSIRFTAPGTYTVKLKVANSTNCGYDEITKTICVNDIPTSSFTVDQNTVCNNLLVKTTNASSSPACGVNAYSWTVGYTSAPGCSPSTSSFSYASGNSSALNPEFSFVNPGTYTIGLVTTSPSGCVSPSFTRNIVVKSKPTVSVSGIPASMCVGTISPMATVANCNATSAATYSWSFPGGSPATSASAIPGTISYATPGTYTIQLEVTNECGTTTVTRSIEIRSIPTVAVPVNQEVCAGATIGPFTFTGTVVGTSFAWTNSASSIGLLASGSGATINAFTANNNTTTPIVATINVTPSAGGCPGAPGTFTITVNPRPAAPTVSSPVIYCMNATSSPLTATTNPANTVLWYDNAGLLGGSTTAPTPSTATSGNTSYYVTQTNAQNCRSNATSITVTVANMISNNVVTGSQTICAGSTANTITATLPTGGIAPYSYQWQSSIDNGTTWNNISSGGNSASYNPGSPAITTLYRRIVTGGPCSHTSPGFATVIVVPTITNFSISASQQICEGQTPATLIGDEPVGGTGAYTYQWQMSTNSNTTWTDIPGANARDYQPAVLTTTTHYRRRTTSGVCSVLSSTVTITVHNTPNAGTLSASVINVCQGANVSISTTGVVGNIQKWQYNLTPADNSTWVDVAQTGATVNFPNVQNSFGVRVVVRQGGSCTNEVTSAISTINATSPSVSGTTSGNATVCATGNGGAITLSGQTGSVLRWERSVNGITWTSIANTTTTQTYLNLTATTSYRAVVQNGVCAAATTNASTITVVPAVTPSNAGPDLRLCNQTQTTLNGNAPSFGTGAWTQTGGPVVTIVNPLQRNTQVTGLQPAQIYKFTWTISGPGACPSSSDEVQIVSTPAITQADAGMDQIVCSFTSGTQQVVLAGNVLENPTFEMGRWTLLSGPANSGIIVNPNDPRSVFSFTRSGTYRLEWSINNNACDVTKDIMEVHVFDKPVAGQLSASNEIACVGNDVQLSTGTSFRGVVAKWQYSFTPLQSTSWKDSLITVNSILFREVKKSFSVRVITISAGAAMGCDQTDTSTIDIEVIPEFNNIIDSTELAVCPGQSISIAGQLPQGAYNVFEYKWQQSKDGESGWTDIPGQTGVNLNMVPLSTVYIRRLVIVSPCVVESAIVYVFVRPSVGRFLMSDSVGTCFPFDVTFTNLVLPSTSTSWNFGDGAFNEGDVVTHTYRSTGRFEVVMTAQYPGGCRFEARGTVEITGPKGIFQHELKPVCLGESTRFEVAAPGVDSIRWSFGDGRTIVSTDKIVHHTYNAAGPYYPTVDLLAGPEGKCRSRLNGNDSIRVDQVEGSFKHSVQQDCGSTSVAFTSSSNAFYGVRTIQWDFGDRTRVIEDDPVHRYAGTNTWRVIQITEGNTGCRDTITRNIPIVVWDIPKIQTNKDTIACVNQTLPFEAHVFSVDPIRETVWNFSSGTPVSSMKAPVTFQFPGSYLALFTATTVNDCSDTIRLPIKVYPSLSIDLGPDKTVSTGTVLPLSSVVTNGPVKVWEWKPGKDLSCNNCDLPYATIKNDITYSVRGVTEQGCVATDAIQIKTFCESAQVFIPNVFTPDGDGLNDLLMVRATGIRTVKSFRVFNRWGAVVFERSNFSPNDRSNGWDGTIKGVKAAPDVYVYTCEVVCENNESYTYKGNITLIK